MNTNTVNLPPGDPKLVTEIVNKVKAEGLFDKFRKDCLADVDTKPAYLNLRQRVEKYVSRFLSSQKWTPNLNKKQLREDLRKQITRSGMLSKGVERVVEQVVDPKINSTIRPEVEKVVSEYLGINHEDRLKRLKLQAEASQSRGDFRGHDSDFSPPSDRYGNRHGPNHPPSLLDLPDINMPPPLFGSPQQPPPPMNPLLPNPMYPGSNIFPMNNPLLPAPGNPMFPPNFGFPMVNYGNMLPPMSTASGFNTGFGPNAGIPTNPGLLPFPMPPMEQPVDDDDDDVDLEKAIREAKDWKDKAEPEKPKMDTAQLLDSLLNIPLPKVEPEESTSKQLKGEGKKGCRTKDSTQSSPELVEVCEVEEEGVSPDITEEQMGVEEITVEEIPLPESSVDATEAQVVEQTVVEGEDKGSKVYHFAWDDIEDRLSDMSVSSVHTSDLSSFEESESEKELEDEEESAKSASSVSANSESEEEKEEEEESSQDEESQPSPSEVAREPSPPKVSKELEVRLSKMVEPEVQEEKKPRRLISLTYNISDSDNDESREDRKARMAREKEDRYLKRQQRRAEIEAKRKEVKSPTKKKREVAQKTDTDSDTENTEAKASEVTTSDFTADESASKAVTKRRTKQQLKEQKVMEKRVALRRQRTRNKRYVSDDFTSIYTDKHPLLNEGYSEVIVEEQVIESGGVEGSDAYVDQGVDLYENEPGTPTQDEVVYDQEIVSTDTENIPIYEVPLPTSNTPIKVGQYNTRLTGRRKSEGKGSRPTTPHSEGSEADLSKGKITPSDRNSPAESKTRSQQRYDTSDLYKPRVSRRRLSPTSSTSSLHDNAEASSKSQRPPSPEGSSKQSSRRSRSRSISRSKSRSKSRSRSRSGSTSSRSKSRSRSRSRSRSQSASRSASRSVTSDSQQRSTSSSPDRRPRTPAEELSFGQAEKFSPRRPTRGRYGGNQQSYSFGRERQSTHNKEESFGEAERNSRYSNRLFNTNKKYARGRPKKWSEPHSGYREPSSSYQSYVTHSETSHETRSQAKEPYQPPEPTKLRTSYEGGAERSEGEISSEEEKMFKGPRTPPSDPEPVEECGPRTPPSEPITPPSQSRSPSPGVSETERAANIRHYTPPRTRGHDRVIMEQHEPSPPHTRFRGKAPPNPPGGHKYSPPPMRDTRRTRTISPPQPTGRALRKRSSDDIAQGGGKRPRH